MITKFLLGMALRLRLTVALPKAISYKMHSDATQNNGIVNEGNITDRAID